MKYCYNCSAFVQTKDNPDAFINREVIAKTVEEAQQKFNEILQEYSFLSVDKDSISIKLK
jgi:hypothetical protein